MRVKLLLLLPIGATLTWANWNAPEMHHFVEPAATVVWQLAPLASPTAAHALEMQLTQTSGVKACAVSWRTNCVAFVYHPAQATPATLARAVRRIGVEVVSPHSVPSPRPAIRQCPVPPGYTLLIDRIRFSLNLRRFFVNA
ncbi:hypothetical protein [Hymenobacter volaticus]|uniref:HMA domain-containing protein n=1 Tax=Hymenobacter volaticus TaxID=2932254 RepID=A0ABY4GGT1_9BACT|nr:hypothetical protein [Hymenobacter volaticus]UOQ69489.1 hypothetical protein MUN86_28850 [Hymenobacter volaticus]